MTVEFQAWPKTARLFRDVVITEKIDGSNAALHITEDGQVFAQSRKRLITPEDDNFGFAGWAQKNATALAETLGVGTHFGEWWGSGINRGYGFTKGLDERFFSLFNTAKWASEPLYAFVPNLLTVPVLYEGVFSQGAIVEAIDTLANYGSYASPDFMRPEGICIFHTQSRKVYKYTPFDGDGHKGNS